jgi:hypothetical protein
MRGMIRLVAGMATVVIGLGGAIAAEEPAGAHKPPIPEAHIGYGAIAYDEEADKEGAAFDLPSQASADDAALQKCGSKECQVHAVQPHYCAALARSDKDRAWGGAEREDLEEAQNEAIAHCQTHTKAGKCAVKLSGCNG